jgi:hypothetical protein
MLSFFKKSRIVFKTLTTVVFALGSYFFFNDYFNIEFESLKQKNMKLFAGIVFGLMAIFKFFDLVEIYRERKRKIV